MVHSISSVKTLSLGDLDTDKLEKLKSARGLKFIGGDERVQYLGHSIHGVAIRRNMNDPKRYSDEKLGKETLSLFTDRGIRLVVRGYEQEWDDIFVGYDCFNKVKYNKGFLKDSIVLKVPSDSSFKLDMRDKRGGVRNTFSRNFVKRPFEIKFRLRATVDSGCQIDEIIDYVQLQMALRKNGLKGWDSTEDLYSRLHDRAMQLSIKQFEISKPDSFATRKECVERYGGLKKSIEVWESADQRYEELKELQSEIEQRVADNFVENKWSKYIPGVVAPGEFTTATEISESYDTLEKKLQELDRLTAMVVDSNQYISEADCEDEISKTECVTDQSIEGNIISRLENQQSFTELNEEVSQLNEALSTSSSLDRRLLNLSFNPHRELILELQSQGFIDSEELDEWYDLVEKVGKISAFMYKTDLSHPSIDAKHWREAVEIAIEDQYVKILSPIVDQIDKMENGMWERDDLYNISWQDFETLIGSLYESFGYSTLVTPDTADMGIDVWAKRLPERVAIQAKRYNAGNKVGRETLQKLASTLAKGDADRVVVVTTSEFTRTAKEYSDSFGSEIELIDGEELVDQLNHSDIPPID